MADVEFSKVPNHLGCSTKIGLRICLFISHGEVRILLDPHSCHLLNCKVILLDRVVPQG